MEGFFIIIILKAILLPAAANNIINPKFDIIPAIRKEVFAIFANFL